MKKWTTTSTRCNSTTILAENTESHSKDLRKITKCFTRAEYQW
jgi:hypothetical protein